MKIGPTQPRLNYNTTPTLPVEAISETAPNDEQFRVIDATIATNVISVYAKRYGRAAARKLIAAMADKYAFG